MKLRACSSVKEVCQWLKDHGITPSENGYVATVYPVHTPTSLHYKTMNKGRVVDGPQKAVTYQGKSTPTRQGNLAIDINDNDVGDDDFRKAFKNETEALTFLWARFVAVFGPDGHDVLDECFFAGFGFIKENPDVNHAITGHTGHMHAGFRRLDW